MFIPKNYTAESVTSGHPDKVCDQISDAILDECLKQDPYSRVAIETFGSHGLLIVAGEVTTKAKVNYKEEAEKIYKSIGYEDKLEVIVNVVEQSPDISMGVNTGGAGDQGIMYGFATSENEEFMPEGSILAHKLAYQLEKTRRENSSILKPDGKTQVTIMDGKISTILVSTQHSEDVSQDDLREIVIKKVIEPIVKNISDIKILVNPTGSFVKGGFMADTGLTGRKIMVDTYGGIIPHGGGCFSGKDSTKVDRSAAYMCRFVAKNVVANGYAKECLVSVAYAIGKEEPLMVEAVNEKGESLSELIKDNFDFRPKAIIEKLNLRSSLFLKTAAYGHFGKKGLPWEEIISF
jgi:S-adenosylmethionine synthetase